MRLSVIILNYNVRYFLEQCVNSVLQATRDLDAEIIVVDNNSQDDSCEMMRRKFPGVKLISNSENAGFPKGNNIGVSAASGKYICILNPDTVVPEDVFAKALKYFESLRNPGILGVRLIDGKGNFLPESKRGVPTPSVAFSKIAGLHKLSSKLFGRYYASHLDEFESGKVDILVGAFMIMERDVYLSVGGFDENCFMYSDDIDLSYTILKSGRENHYFHESTVIHYKGESTVKDRLYITRFSEAMNFFYRKHFRRAIVFDYLMKAGAYFYSMSKAKTQAPEVIIDIYLLIAADDDLHQSLQKVFEGKVLMTAKIPSKNELPSDQGVEVVFDASHLSYLQIITAMNDLKSDKVTFKIAHAKSGFLIGSNSSNGRGHIVNIADYR